ncbi:hypothetical protein [Pseudomonas luteola]|uniref:hypothetical protein n=1 Tax=Pseudomonas luteola TaxID=47886 RepID=UPI0015E2F6B2|nr:hypothetical protein [Pseudomonas zeshuii]MBA1250362.1 hypothetical protein [Pseudomonas zeshuii]
MSLPQYPDVDSFDAFSEYVERSALFNTVKERLADIYRAAEREVVDNYGLVVVGGQALTLWARQYLLNELTGEEAHFVTSDDIDLVGKPGAVEHCEARLKIAFRRATMDDNTPNIGIAEIVWDEDRTIVVDILDKIAGVKEKLLYKHLESVVIDDVRVTLIDPVICLQSRLYNLYAPWCSDHQRESVRVRLAINASRHYLTDLLNEGGYADIRPHIKIIRDLALSQQGKNAFYDYELDILDAIPRDPMLLPELFVQREFRRMYAQTQNRRDRKRIQYERFGRAVRGLGFV